MLVKTSDVMHSGSQVLRALILPPAPAFVSSIDRELGRASMGTHQKKETAEQDR